MPLTKAEITTLRSLADKRGRSATGLFLAEGEKLVGDLIDSPLTVRCVYACTEAAAETFKGHRGALCTITTKEMERISLLKTPTPVMATVEIPLHSFDPHCTLSELVLALDDVQDPGNLGTIIRLADWFGIRHIVCSETSADCFNPKVVQATMGAIARVRVHYTPLLPLLKQSAALGAALYGTFLGGENLYTAPLTPHGVIVMGNEGKGISTAIEAELNRRLYIPPYPAGVATSESLNVAMATAVICAEFRRR